MSAGGGAVGRREVAVRCFAAEYDDASLEYSESDEERAPNYVVTPTGARINRLFVVGVLTEVEQVSDDVLRGRVVDPTGAFVVYAGQYQPEAKTALERAEPPAFVAVTGKARTFEPDDSDRVYTSIRPESINVVDAETRDRWTVQAAEQTIERVSTIAAALPREERGAALTEVLLASGIDPALASGIPRAIAHYGTTEAYLAAIRELALQAAAVVAGERDEVEALDVAPDEGGAVGADLTRGVTIEATATTGGTGAVAGEATTSRSDPAEPGSATTTTEPSESEPEEAEAVDAEPEPEPEGAEPPSTETAEADADVREAADSPEEEELGDFDDYESGTEEAAEEADAATEAPAATDELYELDEEEVAEVEEEFGTEFSTGGEVDGPGEADVETPGPEDQAAGESPSEDAEADAGATAEADAGEVDLVDAVVATMGELDEGAGAERSAVIESVVADHGVEEGAVEDAIQEALMGGRCYEPDDDHVKAI